MVSQLRNLVDAGVSQEELAQILQQLRVLTKEAVQAPPPPPALPTSVPNSYSSSSVTPPQIYPSSFVPSDTTLVQPQTSHPAQFAHPPSSTPPNLVPTVSADVSTNISALFNTLVKAGLVSVPKPTIPAVNDTVVASSTDEKSVEVDHALEASREYCKAVQAIDIKLSIPDIAKCVVFVCVI